jgi:hypothetical protein
MPAKEGGREGGEGGKEGLREKSGKLTNAFGKLSTLFFFSCLAPLLPPSFLACSFNSDTPSFPPSFSSSYPPSFLPSLPPAEGKFVCGREELAPQGVRIERVEHGALGRTF